MQPSPLLPLRCAGRRQRPTLRLIARLDSVETEFDLCMLLYFDYFHLRQPVGPYNELRGTGGVSLRLAFTAEGGFVRFQNGRHRLIVIENGDLGQFY